MLPNVADYVDMKMAVFWVVAPCSLVEVYQRFRGPCCLHYQGDKLMMEAASTSETMVNFYQTTHCYNPEDSHAHSKYFRISLQRLFSVIVTHLKAQFSFFTLLITVTMIVFNFSLFFSQNVSSVPCKVI
jgi:hypothetical protein